MDAGIATGDHPRRCQVAPRAVAGPSHTPVTSAEPGDAFDNVAHGSEAVLERAREGRFWWAPVVDRDDDSAGLDGEQTRLPVMGFEVACDPTAAVEKHHGRRFFTRDAIDARGERP